MLLDQGESSVLVESPTYSGALAALYPMRLNIAKVPSDDDGLQPDALQHTLETWDESKAPRPRVLYTVPNGCNPTGASLSLNRRHRVYELCCEHDIIIMEDDPYFYLQYTSPRLPSLFSLDTEGRVLRFDSFSKIVSSGLRMGFVSGPPALLEQLQLHGQAVSLHASGISQALLLKVLEAWGADGFHQHVNEVVAFYARQKEAFFASAERHLSGLASWNPHVSAGMFAWLKTHVPDTKALIQEKAVDAKVLLVPGEAFIAPDKCDLRAQRFDALPRSPSPYVRAAYSTATPQDMDTALQRLASLLRAEQ
ncbi:hypothetical protein PTSG_09009 [Salpingoeca rosetta]|uniref:Aminotransferase class I/classII large domain-containing protein n=1 Tax=Salpingoeca rosetta (strain ATCC 50818 / BSB-021) TaxID=946362 RepID=F2ULY3_SALR5|nr:uncharacterized protein PTSG_09009 [Salpingoeca rosetta]EGD78132.1 hypothetical protein PTSG_09009 [Salpingoeca rosetta]|eukprot:XP_004989808.1 hypothetical protein PTSG_09009 [Salpingoeca rosetta]